MKAKTKTKTGKTFRKWHLAKTEADSTIVDLEFGFLRLMRAFNRFNENAVKSISGHTISAAEINLLHVIRMRDTGKSSAVLASLLNRDDYSNVQYGLKKLRDLKLIRVHSRSSSKQYSYDITAKGRALTEQFVQIREKRVTKPMQSIHEWESKLEDATDLIRLLTGIYEEAAREALVNWDDK